MIQMEQRRAPKSKRCLDAESHQRRERSLLTLVGEAVRGGAAGSPAVARPPATAEAL